MRSSCVFVKISPAKRCQILSLTNLEWKHVSNVMMQNFSDGAPFLFSAADWAFGTCLPPSPPPLLLLLLLLLLLW